MRLFALWIGGTLRRRFGRVLAAALGVAITIAMLGSVADFVMVSAAQMTQRAVAGVPVDWQVQVAPGADPTTVRQAIEAAAACDAIAEVGYADVAGFSASTGGTVQTTGAGKVLGISADYIAEFPGEIRQLLGTTEGVMIAQQTAANLHVAVGDQVSVQRVGRPPVNVTVAGVIDLPNADSLFQAVGVPAGSAPQAPPDNVLLLPMNQWQALFDGSGVATDHALRQFHVRISHVLPDDPSRAYIKVTGLANNALARMAGQGSIGDNLAARLAGVREDALYARVLFVFLGLPGAVLALLFTLAIAESGADRRRRDQGLLRLRGAAPGQILGLAAGEALLVAAGGIILGLGLTLAAHRMLAPSSAISSTFLSGWALASLAGTALAAWAVMVPAWRDAYGTTIARTRLTVSRGGRPLWQRTYLDVLVLLVAGAELWRTAGSGYQIVLAPEGVPQTAVHYEAFLVPLCLWVGGVLLAIRLLDMVLANKQRLVSRWLRPLTGALSATAASWLSRQQAVIKRGAVLIALALSFACSTAVFNTTYNAQARIDAELTNGADVAITGTSASPPSVRLAALRSLPGAASVQTMQHRFAYVGNDLQDIYGIDPATIGSVTDMSNAYFAGITAQQALTGLSQREDAVLVSAETVSDYQLRPGDRLNLRLMDARDHQYHVVPFTFIGVVREFPTAPTDSFLVANASYIAAKTGSDAAETVLMRANGNPAALASLVSQVTQSLAGVKVQDIASAQRAIDSSLTSVDLHGLTRLYLAFAAVLVAGIAGLVLALGITERRRLFAILSAIGASDRQLASFVRAEAGFTLLAGAATGVPLGFGIAQVLVKVLSGVFDPPPEALSVPGPYLALLAFAALGAALVAVAYVRAVQRRTGDTELRAE